MSLILRTKSIMRKRCLFFGFGCLLTFFLQHPLGGALSCRAFAGSRALHGLACVFPRECTSGQVAYVDYSHSNLLERSYAVPEIRKKARSSTNEPVY